MWPTMRKAMDYLRLYVGSTEGMYLVIWICTVHVNLLHVCSCYYIHWYKYAHNYNNFVENVLGIFKKNCFILQSVATPSRPLSHSRPMYYFVLCCFGWTALEYTPVMQDTIVNMYHAWISMMIVSIHSTPWLYIDCLIVGIKLCTID